MIFNNEVFSDEQAKLLNQWELKIEQEIGEMKKRLANIEQVYQAGQFEQTFPKDEGEH